MSREKDLRPRYEMERESFELEGKVLRKGQTQALEQWQRKSAVGHWEVMRTVLPDGVWVNW
jgi:endonuclease I